MEMEVLHSFFAEVVGGALIGVLIGFFGWWLILAISKNSHLAVLLTLAVALGGYSLAQVLQVSGPLTMVVAGLIIGSNINRPYFSIPCTEIINSTWKILNDTLNAILFVLIGLVIHLLTFEPSYLLLGGLAVLVVLLSRFISVLIPFSLLKHEGIPSLKAISIMTWGGLRGGISVALALSIADIYSGELILFITYSVVLFSIIVQGLSLGKVVKKLEY